MQNNKIIVINDYNLHKDYENFKIGKMPGHLIFGLHKFKEFGFETELVKLWEPGPLFHLDNWLIKHKPIIPIGRTETQVKTLQKIKDADAILCLKETESYSLHYLRAMQVIRIPIITLVHHPQNIGRMNWLRKPLNYCWHRGADAVLTFSNKIPLQGQESHKVKRVSWGPDVRYYDSLKPTYGNQIMTAGRSGRDFNSFAVASINTGSSAHIMCLEHDAETMLKKLPPHILMEVGWQEPHDVYNKLKNALAIAIPLLPQKFTSGLTSLCDALGMGKAVLMPENIGIDLDVEKLGIGKIVRPNNIEGWSKTLTWVKEHREQTIKMGTKAREFALQNYNCDLFAKSVSDCIKKCIAREPMEYI
jgi:glycosyltransferase involved in cell wall biosynthesis